MRIVPANQRCVLRGSSRSVSLTYPFTCSYVCPCGSCGPPSVPIWRIRTRERRNRPGWVGNSKSESGHANLYDLRAVKSVFWMALKAYDQPRASFATSS